MQSCPTFFIYGSACKTQDYAKRRGAKSESTTSKRNRNHCQDPWKSVLEGSFWSFWPHLGHKLRPTGRPKCNRNCPRSIKKLMLSEDGGQVGAKMPLCWQTLRLPTRPTWGPRWPTCRPRCPIWRNFWGTLAQRSCSKTNVIQNVAKAKIQIKDLISVTMFNFVQLHIFRLLVFCVASICGSFP